MEKQYRPLKELVYDYISEKIASGELGAGDRVPEPMICDALGVSRTPVREALIQLTTEGYLENLPRRGFRVRGVTEESAMEIYQVLGPLDGQAAYLALPRLGDGDFRQMSFLIGSMDLAIDSRMFDRYDGLQREFHTVYQGKCGNARLLSLIGELERSFMRPGYGAMNDDERAALLAKANREHARILELLQAGEGTAVRDYIRDVHWSTENSQYSVW
ncbi:MAG: GntR family transcriptional regulator [Olegusella sp.]|nr:GntR family transcriptional regulator [Olegusella sp.]